MADARDALAFTKQRIAVVEALAKTGWKKLNLMPESEGVWCVPLTKDDAHKMEDDDSEGEKVRVYLVNTPIGWGGRTWGAEVIGTTRGDLRAVAHPEDQTPLDADAKLLWQGMRLRAEEEAEAKFKFHLPYMLITFLDTTTSHIKKDEALILAALVRKYSDPAKPDGNFILQGIINETEGDRFDFAAYCAKLDEDITAHGGETP